jgi:hypothetical protein
MGFRAAAARNAGARLASAPVLVFIDSGTLAGPDFLSAHLDANAATPSRAVIGDTYGYRPHDLTPGLAETISQLRPGEVIERFRGIGTFRDWRADELVKVDFDVNRRAVPWLLFWTTNISLRAADFCRVGGFDEDFRNWGSEDLELGFRLHRAGVRFMFSHEAWAIETPHERDTAANMAGNEGNLLMFLAKHPEPVIELTWALFMRDLLWPVEYEYQALLNWADRARHLDVRDELAFAAGELPATTTRVAVFGCGGITPASLPAGCALMDFDRDLVGNATAHGSHEGYHAIGIRTLLPDQYADAVIITSRLGGLWHEWSCEILAEARRIGRTVWYEGRRSGDQSIPVRL